MGAYLSRRNLLRAGAGVAAAAGLAGCGDGGPAARAGDNAKVRLPDHVPYKGVAADLPATDKGVLAGYFHYPEHPRPAAPDGPPAKGPSIRVMTITYNPVPPPAGKNPMWRRLNETLGTDLEFEISPATDYAQKFPLTIAGGQLPDGMLVLPTAAAQSQMMPALFEDLSPHLSGPAVRAYPYLANIPAKSWADSVIAGGLYGLPMPRLNSGSAMMYRADIFAKKGVDPHPGSFREFFRLCTDVSDPKHAKYAIGDPLFALYFVLEMVGGANLWREKGGRFTYWVEELDLLHRALDAMRQLVKAGAVHPDGFTIAGNAKTKDWFGTGQTAVNYDGITGWNNYLDQYGATDPDFAIDAMVAPGFDGGPGTHWAGLSSFAMLCLKKAPRQRIEQLLRAFDLMAAPFGTDHYLLRKYGVPGHDFHWKGHDPLLTPEGVLDIGLPTGFTTDAPQSIYYPKNTDAVRKQYAFQQRATAVLVPNSAEGLYSETDVTLGGAAVELLREGPIKGYMRGSTDWGELRDAVRDWRRKVGDKARAEFEKAYEDLHA
ncbi:ABC transporter substrate-binding protein [Streptomyces sp. NPDC050560]|uniref:ABC transporter substrate-binding protein n=1 Tax=Streptomyces sp. NPDC050560 TaxID=3365630 RepID=UPI003796BE87